MFRGWLGVRAVVEGVGVGIGLEEDVLGRAEADRKARVAYEGSKSHTKQHWGRTAG